MRGLDGEGEEGTVRWRLTHVAETESTNLLARGGVPGDAFSADFQTAGRGRLGHRWTSERGKNLILSAVVDVSRMEPGEAATLPLAAGLAVAEALREFTAATVALKWPNDILVDGRKICGILCERRGGSAIVGIGVNVRQMEFPPDVAPCAVSLAMLGSAASVADVRDVILASLGRVLEEWRRGFAAVWPRIAAIDFLKGRTVAVRPLDGAAPSAAGLCGGIRCDGSLDVGGCVVWAGEAHIGL